MINFKMNNIKKNKNKKIVFSHRIKLQIKDYRQKITLQILKNLMVALNKKNKYYKISKLNKNLEKNDSTKQKRKN